MSILDFLRNILNKDYSNGVNSVCDYIANQKQEEAILISIL